MTEDPNSGHNRLTNHTLPRRRSFVIGLLLASSAWGVPAATAAPAGCRDGDPLANVRDPGRLRVLRRCVSATGVIRFAQRENDGDVHMSLAVDRRYSYLLNDGNRHHHYGTLVVEIVPADQSGCRKGERVQYGKCTGAHVRTPGRGERVRVTGPWVLDQAHGWREIHPAWRIDRL
ncbi:MAG TPA: hypothetical protein VG034_17620 [Acidimicrobiia bacterium]|nr:hypothetical protein [Acidimicrobiia bacterium]